MYIVQKIVVSLFARVISNISSLYDSKQKVNFIVPGGCTKMDNKLRFPEIITCSKILYPLREPFQLLFNMETFYYLKIQN